MFAKNLKELRLSKNLTQEQFGEMIGVTGANVTRYEKGLALPKVSTLLKITNTFNVSIDKLLNIQVDKEQQQMDYINSLIKPHYEISKSDAEGEFIIKRIMRRKSDIFPHDMVRLNLPDFCTMSVEKLNDVIKFVNEEKRNAMREAYFTQFDTWFMTQTLLGLTKRLQDVEK